MNETRKALSKRLRFRVFARDQFTCQYCGRKPPAVVLEVDHVIALSKGGSSEEHNLLTSCFDCNRGKADGIIEAAPIDIAARAALVRERSAQVKAYNKVLEEERARLDTWVDEIIGVYELHFEGWTLLDRTRASIRNFLTLLPPQVVYESMELACGRVNKNRAFRYFCGICWNKIRQTQP